MDALLEQVLTAEAQASAQESPLVEGFLGLLGGESIRDDPVALQEGAQDAVGEEGATALDHLERVELELLDPLLPAAVIQLEEGSDLAAELLLLGEEELEFQQVAQSHHLGPESRDHLAAVGLDRVEHGELGDGAGDEEVDDRVSIVGGGELLVLGDAVDRLEPLVEARDDIVRDEGLEGERDAFLGCEMLEVSGRGQRSLADVLDQIAE